TTGLTLRVATAGAWPNSVFGTAAAATAAAALVACTNSRRFILRPIPPPAARLTRSRCMPRSRPALPRLSRSRNRNRSNRSVSPDLRDSVRGLAFEERVGLQRLRSLLRAHRVGALVHRDAGVFTFGVQHVKIQPEVRLALRVEQPFLDGVPGDAFERRHRRIPR